MNSTIFGLLLPYLKSTAPVSQKTVPPTPSSLGQTGEGELAGSGQVAE